MVQTIIALAITKQALELIFCSERDVENATHQGRGLMSHTHTHTHTTDGLVCSHTLIPATANPSREPVHCMTWHFLADSALTEAKHEGHT